MSPLVVRRCNVPLGAMIGALRSMPLSATRLNAFALLHKIGLATVMVPPDGAAAADDVVTVTFPRLNAFCRAVCRQHRGRVRSGDVEGVSPWNRHVTRRSDPRR